ncbi:hypothetical protein E0K83_06695 [Gramella sp. BOM4]|nr:hypothetical protein [Christiangramia bathymodioli]
MTILRIKKSRIFLSMVICLLFITGISCTNEPDYSEFETADLNVNSTESVKITSTGLNFDMPDRIPSGWTNFKYKNESGMTHFFLLLQLPEDKTLEDYLEEVTPVFQAGMDYYREGDFANAFGAEGFGGLPAWYGNMSILGGSGMISPYSSSHTTLDMQPGNYVVECYVKGRNGKFHSYNGMITELEVTEEDNNRKEPDANVTIEVSTDNISLLGNINRPGNHTFSVDYLDQTAYGNLLGHDVHLVKFENGFSEENTSKLNNWMNWLYIGDDLEGLMAPVPEGFTFMGGVQELPAGSTGYFTAVLQKGDYALVAEVDDPVGRGLYVEFTIE